MRRKKLLVEWFEMRRARVHMDLNLKDRNNIRWGNITADSFAALSTASLTGMLERAGI